MKENAKSARGIVVAEALIYPQSSNMGTMSNLVR
jgi:hypothetical protein